MKITVTTILSSSWNFIFILLGCYVQPDHRLIATNGTLWQALRSKLKISAQYLATFVADYIYFTPLHHFVLLYHYFSLPSEAQSSKNHARNWNTIWVLRVCFESTDRSSQVSLLVSLWIMRAMHVEALPRLLFWHCLPLLLVKMSELVVGHANSQPGN